MKFKSENENVLMTSMKVSYHIAHEDEVNEIRKKLVKPCANNFAGCMTDKEAARKIQLVPLSNYKIQRIQDCAVNVLDELL